MHLSLKRHCFAFLPILLGLIQPQYFAHASSNCLSDYRVNQNWQPHFLSAGELAIAESYARAGNPQQGWRYVGSLGDPYAALAANVVASTPHTISAIAHRFVRQHWVNVVGEEKTAANFFDFARQHYRQYVEILLTGTWPDADQILNSYLYSARSHGLPDLVIFDAAWTASDASQMVSWQVLNGLSFGRQIYPSKICLHISRKQANRLLLLDFSGH